MADVGFGYNIGDNICVFVDYNNNCVFNSLWRNTSGKLSIFIIGDKFFDWFE